MEGQQEEIIDPDVIVIISDEEVEHENGEQAVPSAMQSDSSDTELDNKQSEDNTDVETTECKELSCVKVKIIDII